MESEARVALKDGRLRFEEERRWRERLDQAQNTDKREQLHDREVEQVKWSRATKPHWQGRSGGEYVARV